MARKDPRIKSLLDEITVLREAPVKWVEGWEIGRIRALLEQRSMEAQNELIEIAFGIMRKKDRPVGEDRGDG